MENNQDIKIKILEESLRQFSEFGFDSVSLRSIANEVGVNHGMIRYYFTNKENLWNTAIKFLFERLDTEFSLQQDASKSERERAIDFLRRYVLYCARYPEHAKIMLLESIGSHKLLKNSVPYIAKQHEKITNIFERWIENGVLPDLPIISLIYSIVGMSQLPFALANEVKAIHDTDVKSEAFVNQHCDTVIALIFGTDHSD